MQVVYLQVIYTEATREVKCMFKHEDLYIDTDKISAMRVNVSKGFIEVRVMIDCGEINIPFKKLESMEVFIEDIIKFKNNS